MALNTWLLTKLRGLYRVLADGIPMPDVPTINFVASLYGTTGAAYDSVNNRITVTLPLGSVASDPDTFVMRDGDAGISCTYLTAVNDISCQEFTASSDATVGGALHVSSGVGQFGAASPTVKPIITGSRSGATVAVVAQLLTVLAASGTFTNSTTS